MMNVRDKGFIVLISAPIVALICVLSLIIFHVERLPDPLNVIVILAVAFGSMSLIFYIFVTRYLPKIRPI